MYRQTFNAVYVLNIVLQSIFTLLFDVGIFVLLGWLFTAKLSFERWVFNPLILLGIALGVFSMVKLILISMKNLEALEESQINSKNKKAEGDPEGGKTE